MTKLITLLLLTATFAFAADAGTDKPSVVDQLYDKAVADSTRDASKAYDMYQTALNTASQKVLKALETAKADLNDSKKFTKLTITERADAIKAIDEKIQAVKDGAVGETIVARKTKSDLLGDAPKADAFLGKWKIAHNATAKDFMVWTVSPKGVINRPGMTGTWKMVDANSIIIAWSADNWTDTLDIKAGTMTTAVGNATFVASKMEK